LSNFQHVVKSGRGRKFSGILHTFNQTVSLDIES